MIVVQIASLDWNNNQYKVEEEINLEQIPESIYAIQDILVHLHLCMGLINNCLQLMN